MKNEKMGFGNEKIYILDPACRCNDKDLCELQKYKENIVGTT